MKDYFAERSQCPQCLETGFMIISMPDEDVLVACGCNFGELASVQYGVTQWSFNLHKVFKTQPLDAHWFKPEQGTAGSEKLWRWQQMLKHAKEYWRAY